MMSTLNNFQLFSAQNNFSVKYSPASIAIPMMGQPRSTTRMPPKKQPLPFNFSGCTKNLVDLLTPITSMRPENIEPFTQNALKQFFTRKLWKLTWISGIIMQNSFGKSPLINHKKSVSII